MWKISSQTKWPLQQAETFTDITYICICIHRHMGQILQALKADFWPHYQCNGVCEAAQSATCASASADTTKPQMVCSHGRDCNGSSFPKSLLKAYTQKWLTRAYFSQTSFLSPVVASAKYRSSDAVAVYTRNMLAGWSPGWCKDGSKLFFFHHPLWGLPRTAWAKLESGQQSLHTDSF